MQIKFLAGEGVPKKRIAERLGVSRQTVYNHLNRKKGEPFPKSRPARPSLLDPFKDYIEARLERFDLPATVVFQEIKEKGYRGRLTILRDFVRPLKQEFMRRVTERFETLPGQQAQIDWGECGTIEVDGERKRLYVFVMVLGYSRLMYARFTTCTKLPILLTCLARAFDALGIPKEILVDNMKQAVDQHDVIGDALRHVTHRLTISAITHCPRAPSHEKWKSSIAIAIPVGVIVSKSVRITHRFVAAHGSNSSFVPLHAKLAAIAS